MRGIGRYAWDVVHALGELEVNALLLTDPSRPEPADTARADNVISLTAAQGMAFDLLIQPSPLTHSVAPLVPALNRSHRRATIVHDFIPLDFPDVYLGTEEVRAAYAARLRALKVYDHYICNSLSTQSRLQDLLATDIDSRVAWPDYLQMTTASDGHQPDRTSILVVAGDDLRKNTMLGANAAIQVAKNLDLRVEVLGVPWESLQLHGSLETTQLECHFRVDDDHVKRLFRRALVTVVPSSAEGLSLPVLEALKSGSPVCASDIDVHRELLGEGPHLFSVADGVPGLARSLTYVAENFERVLRNQRDSLDSHGHHTVHDAVKSLVLKASTDRVATEGSRRRRSRTRISVISPLPPARSGVADLSHEMLSSLRRRCDVLAIDTADRTRHPRSRLHDFLGSVDRTDAQLAVLGNSHFHLDELLAAEATGCPVLCHDVRMTELNTALYGEAGAAEIASLNAQGTVFEASDVRTWVERPNEALNSGFGRISRFASTMLFHSRSAADRIRRETGHKDVRHLPFPVYRVPTADEWQSGEGVALRRARGISDLARLVVVFGEVDIRTKAADTCLQALGYLQAWGIPASLVFVGPVSPQVKADLEQLLNECHIHGVLFTGSVEESEYRNWLRAADASIVLRNGEDLSLSGAALDVMAYGVPTVMTESIADDCGQPGLAVAVPSWFTGLIVAEALEEHLSLSESEHEMRELAEDFVTLRSMDAYSKLLLEHLVDS